MSCLTSSIESCSTTCVSCISSFSPQSVWMLTQINFITHSFCILFLKHGSTGQMRHLLCVWLRKRVYVETCWKTPGKSAQMSNSQVSRLSPYAICVIGSWVMTDVAGLWNCWPLAGDLEGWFCLCSGSWVCQPSSLFLYIAEIPWQSGNPLVLRARLASLTQTCVVFLFVEVNYCPPLEVLGLEKDKGFLEQELWVNLVTSARPRAIVLQEGRPRLEVLGVRQLLRFIKWGLLNCDSLLEVVDFGLEWKFYQGYILARGNRHNCFFAFFLKSLWVMCAVPSKTRRGYEIPLLGTVVTGELPCACWELNLGVPQEQPVFLTAEPSLWPQYSVILYQEWYLEQ